MLEGKVSDFSLPEIFQLIALTKKSGTLSVATPEQQGRVRFRDGEVCEAAADVRRFALGSRLVAAGLVDESRLVAALEAKKGGGGDLLSLLLEHADVDEGSLHAFVREQIADAVADLLRLEDATFRFDADEGEHEPPIDVKVATDQLVTEGNQRLAEWDAIRRQVPSPASVFALSPSATRGGEDVTVDADAWELLALVDGRRTVREIVSLSGRSEFSTSRVLANLVGRGLVEPCTEDGGPLAALIARHEVLQRLEGLELDERAMDPSSPAPVTEQDPESAGSAVDAPQDDATALAPPAEPDDAATTPVVFDADDMREQPADGLDADPGALLADPPAEQSADPDELTLDDATDDSVPPAPAELLSSALAAELPLDDDVVDVGTEGTDADADEATDATGGHDAPPAAPAGEIDRAQVARELASLGFDDAPAPTAAPTGGTPAGEAPAEGERRLVRDQDLNKGLLLRLIDGVKGA